MDGEWREVVRVRFRGDRFRDHALDVSALAELANFQELVQEIAQELWRRGNPDRQRLPRHFEDRTRLFLRRLEDGSAIAPLEVYVDEGPDTPLFEIEPEIATAVDLAQDAIGAIEQEQDLPAAFPLNLLPFVAKIGGELEAGESIEIESRRGGRPAVITQESRRTIDVLGPSREGRIELVGRVLEADVRQGRFEMWPDERSRVIVKFSPEQEEVVTTALRDHNSAELNVTGDGLFNARGKPVRIMRVDTVMVRPSARGFDLNATPIEQVFAEIAASVDENDWSRVPEDLSANLDRHLYGRPDR